MDLLCDYRSIRNQYLMSIPRVFLYAIHKPGHASMIHRPMTRNNLVSEQPRQQQTHFAGSMPQSIRPFIPSCSSFACDEHQGQLRRCLPACRSGLGCHVKDVAVSTGFDARAHRHQTPYPRFRFFFFFDLTLTIASSIDYAPHPNLLRVSEYPVPGISDPLPDSGR